MTAQARCQATLALLLICVAPLWAEEVERPVVAVVNGEELLFVDLERHLSRMHGTAEEGARADFELDQLMFKVVNDVLLAQEARALGMHEEEPVAGKVRDFTERQALAKLLRMEVDALATATEEEIREAFEDQYREVSFRIVTAYDQAGAEELLAALRDGADMEQLAGERSVDPYRLRGGRVGSLPRRRLERGVAEVVFSLTPGELGGPVRTDLGWSVVRAEAFKPPDPEQLELRRATLGSLVRQGKGAALRARLAGSIRERHPVEIDQERVEAMSPERLPDGRLTPSGLSADGVVVRVGAQSISVKEYGAALLERWSGVRNEEAAAAAAPIILQRLIERELLLAEALERGYGDDPDIRRAAHALETQLLIPRYLEEVVSAGIEISQEEKESYYEENRDRFRRPPRVRLGQITVESEEEAKRIAGVLSQGGDLAWLAREHSVDRYREEGGDRGWYTPPAGGDEFSRRVLAAGVGEVLEPIGTQNTWVVTKILVREDQGVYSFEEVSGNVRTAVFSSKFQETLHELLQKLRERSEVEIREDVVARLMISGSAEEEEGAGAH